MSQADLVFCRRLARLTSQKKLSSSRKAAIRFLLQNGNSLHPQSPFRPTFPKRAS